MSNKNNIDYVFNGVIFSEARSEFQKSVYLFFNEDKLVIEDNFDYSSLLTIEGIVSDSQHIFDESSEEGESFTKYEVYINSELDENSKTLIGYLREYAQIEFDIVSIQEILTELRSSPRPELNAIYEKDSLTDDKFATSYGVCLDLFETRKKELIFKSRVISNLLLQTLSER